MHFSAPLFLAFVVENVSFFAGFRVANEKQTVFPVVGNAQVQLERLQKFLEEDANSRLVDSTLERVHFRNEQFQFENVVVLKQQILQFLIFEANSGFEFRLFLLESSKKASLARMFRARFRPFGLLFCISRTLAGLFRVPLFLRLAVSFDSDHVQIWMVENAVELGVTERAVEVDLRLFFQEQGHFEETLPFEHFQDFGGNERVRQQFKQKVVPRFVRFDFLLQVDEAFGQILEGLFLEVALVQNQLRIRFGRLQRGKVVQGVWLILPLNWLTLSDWNWEYSPLREALMVALAWNVWSNSLSLSQSSKLYLSESTSFFVSSFSEIVFRVSSSWKCSDLPVKVGFHSWLLGLFPLELVFRNSEFSRISFLISKVSQVPILFLLGKWSNL